MRFQEFWPLYLRAHRLPGTRALHYVATVVGILSAIDAIAAHQPLIFVVGIALAYGLAIAAHWLIEGNQPLIRVNAFWGAVADMRMCWLAITGGLAAEFQRHGVVVDPVPETAPAPTAPHGRGVRTVLTLASAGGLLVGLSDLWDLMEPVEVLVYPVIQLGAPIVAFSAALLVACMAHVVARRQVAMAGPGTSGAPRGKAFAPAPASEASLRRASLALLALGLAAFGLAELMEHGLPQTEYADAAIATLVALLCIGLLLAWRAAGLPISLGRLGPATRGLRVDGRVEWVDLLEGLLSLGRRRRILQAALNAATLRAGDRVVDIGCGTGELAMMAARSGAGEAIGIDATPGMIDLARRNAQTRRSRARFEVALAEALPFEDGTIDAVTSSFFFHHLPSDLKREAMREMWRVLSPGGRLVIADYGQPRGLLGLLASFPMRFNFHEYVRPQLRGELERLIESEGLGQPQVAARFLGYIAVLRLVKPA